jgi:hypothetical protein
MAMPIAPKLGLGLRGAAQGDGDVVGQVELVDLGLHGGAHPAGVASTLPGVSCQTAGRRGRPARREAV